MLLLLRLLLLIDAIAIVGWRSNRQCIALTGEELQSLKAKHCCCLKTSCCLAMESIQDLRRTNHHQRMQVSQCIQRDTAEHRRRKRNTFSKSEPEVNTRQAIG